MPFDLKDSSTLWLFTSLSSGSSKIVTATSRLETILKANRIAFQAVDLATDDAARRLWTRRAGKSRSLPGVVRGGEVLGDINEVEEWNEFGETREMLAPEGESISPVGMMAKSTFGQPAAKGTDKPATKEVDVTAGTPKDSTVDKTSPKSPSGAVSPLAATMQQIGFEAAERAGKAKSKLKSPTSKPSNSTKSTTENKNPETKTATESKAAEPLEGDAATKTSAQDDTASKLTPENQDDLAKLDNSAGLPPPSGESNAIAAQEPATGAAKVESSADAVPASADSKTESATRTELKSNPTNTTEFKADSSTGPRSNETAVKSPDLAATDNLADALTGSETTSHRRPGSSISAASPAEVAAVEEASKIEEEPEAEENEAAAMSRTTQVISPGAAKQDLIQSPTSDYSNPPSDEVAEEQAEEKRKEEPHVKFAGETPGQEIDRVKAQLGGKSAGGKEGEEQVTSPVEAEARGRTLERKASEEEGDGAEKEEQAGKKESDEAIKAEKDEKVGTKEESIKPAEDKPTPTPIDQTTTAVEHVASTDKGEDLPGTTTQEQPAAEGAKASESVAD